MPHYDPHRIEPKWQQYWEEHATFRAPDVPQNEKLYVLDMFPYPSGEGLHVGHPVGYLATDMVCRYQRMQGKDVLHPMGWDAFGLPAEQHAVKTGTPPRVTTYKNIDTYRRQLKMLGFSYDWSREFATTDALGQQAPEQAAHGPGPGHHHLRRIRSGHAIAPLQSSA